MPTVFVPLDRVQDSPYQPRRHYDPAAVEALADSIARDGQLQTPVGRFTRTGDTPFSAPSTAEVIKSGDLGAEMDRQSIVCQLALGHRRARAWRLLWDRHRDTAPEFRPPGMDGVPVDAMPVTLEPLTDEQMFARGVTENRQREGISAVEEAEAMQAAIESFGWTHEVIGERFGYTRATVSNKLRLLKLPEAVREIVVEGLLPERTARALVAMFDLDDRLAPFATHRDVQDRRLGDLEIRMKLEGGETHEGFAAYVRRYLQQVEALADADERERAPGLDFGDDTPEAGAPEAEDLGSVGAWVSIRQNGSFASAERTRVELPSQGAFDVDGKTYHVVPSVSRLHADGTPDIDLGHGRDQFDVIDPDGEIVCRYSKTVAAAEREARSRIRHAATLEATEDDTYDDGGARLGQIAETVGEDLGVKAPATPPPTSEPDANLHEPPFGIDEDGEPLTEAEMVAREAEAADWAALTARVYELATTVPMDVRKMLSPLVDFPKRMAGADRDAWADAFSEGVLAKMRELDAGSARAAAYRFNLIHDVAWPEADVSADTIRLTPGQGGERDVPIRRRFEAHGHEWAVVPTLRMGDSGELRLGGVLDVVHVGTAASLRVARQRLTSVDEAETAAREVLDRQGPGKIEAAISDVTQSDAPKVSADTSTVVPEGEGFDFSKPEPAAFSGTRPSEAADPVAATRAALDAGDDPHLLRRDLKEARRGVSGPPLVAIIQALSLVNDHIERAEAGPLDETDSLEPHLEAFVERVRTNRAEKPAHPDLGPVYTVRNANEVAMARELVQRGWLRLVRGGLYDLTAEAEMWKAFVNAANGDGAATETAPEVAEA